jgi:hypothetical protein
MTHVIGIDPSSKKVAICTTFTSKPEFKIIDLPEGVYPATGAAFREVFAFLGEEDCGEEIFIYLEAPVVGRNAYSTIVQAQVGGAVMAAAQNRGAKLFMVNVNSWKKQVVGKGNATKPEVAEWLEKYWPDAYNLANGDQDLIDAAAINRYGYKHVRLAQAIVKRSKRGNHQG